MSTHFDPILVVAFLKIESKLLKTAVEFANLEAERIAALK